MNFEFEKKQYLMEN